ncbi:hypothetical protein PR048_006416 [Dryococelus australis]|uniref:DDE-1 domain-containing protein n=1 Tax=Dryococelus australis TaxID=614101 RepID=A0ABQ9IC92_9NEOP|nr:hypothetical protein PR048_006416 [Dryococelus australis]
MRRALTALEEGMQFESAARQFNVLVIALKRRHKSKNMYTVNDVKTLGSKKCVFLDEQEEELVAHIVDMKGRMHGLTNLDVRSLAYQLAVKKNISHPFCNETKLAGKDWLRGFRRRLQELSLRCPESTSEVRARAFNRPIVNKFFSHLHEDGAPPRSVFACNDSGWLRMEVFSQWFDHFLANVKPTGDDPALLILDRHLSHTKNLEVIVKARQNYVSILCLPPHFKYKLQPLDVGVMRVVALFRIGHIFGESYLQACTPLNIINGFRKTGIIPYNPNVFIDVDFAAMETTEQAVLDEPDVPDESVMPDGPNEFEQNQNTVPEEQRETHFPS